MKSYTEGLVFGVVITTLGFIVGSNTSLREFLGGVWLWLGLALVIGALAFGVRKK